MFPGYRVQEKKSSCKAEELQLVKKRLNSKKDGRGNIGVIFKTFPWLENFFQTAFQTTVKGNIENLQSIMVYFFREVSLSMEDCWKKPREGVCLRFLMEEILVYFSGTYRRSKPSSSTQKFYINAMTDLVAIFIDLKIMLVRRGLENLKKMDYSLLAVLFLFLDNSEEHVAEALLKAKGITRTNENICSSLLRKFLNEGQFIIKNEESYLRFIFIFKLWKDVTTNAKEKMKINWLATFKLKPSKLIVRNVRQMEWIHPLLPQIHPQNNITFVLMNLKLDFINAKREFFKRYELSNKYQSNFSELTHLDLGLKSHRLCTLKDENLSNMLKGVFPNKVYIKEETQESTESFGGTSKITKLFQTEFKEAKDQKPSLFLPKRQEFPHINRNLRKPTKKKPCIHLCSYQCSQGIQTFPSLKHEVTEIPNDELKQPEMHIQNVEFDKLAECYKIVKSKSLKIGLISKEEHHTKTKGSLKKINFCSKVVKVPEGELLGSKPKERMKSLRTIRRERLEDGKNEEGSWVKEKAKSKEEVKTDWLKPQTGSFEAAENTDGNDSCREMKDLSQFDQEVLEKIISEDSLSVGNFSLSSSSKNQTLSGSEFPELFDSREFYHDPQEFSTNFEKKLLTFDEECNIGVNSSTILDFEEFDKDYFSLTKDKIEGNLREDLYNFQSNTLLEDLMDFTSFDI